MKFRVIRPFKAHWLAGPKESVQISIGEVLIVSLPPAVAGMPTVFLRPGEPFSLVVDGLVFTTFTVEDVTVARASAV